MTNKKKMCKRIEDIEKKLLSFVELSFFKYYYYFYYFEIYF